MLQEELTERQNNILKFIVRTVRTSGYPPTLREIGTELGIRSTNGVNDHLKALMRKGYLAKETGKSRTLKLLNPKAAKTSKRPKYPDAIMIFDNLNSAPKSPGIFGVFDNTAQQINIYRTDRDGSCTILTNFHFAI